MLLKKDLRVGDIVYIRDLGYYILVDTRFGKRFMSKCYYVCFERYTNDLRYIHSNGFVSNSSLNIISCYRPIKKYRINFSTSAMFLDPKDLNKHSISDRLEHSTMIKRKDLSQFIQLRRFI